MGLFYPFLKDNRVKLVGVEAAGDGIESSRHAASICAGSVGVLHGAKTYLLQDEHGQITETHSISAGLDYPGVGPEHSLLADGGRVSYQAVDDNAAVEAFHTLTRLEGIIPALESAHAVAAAVRIAPDIGKGGDIIVNLSGRGDKDINTIASLMEVTLR
jgi:tryptophan synthase beta chain